MKINADLMPVIEGVVYGVSSVTVSKGKFKNTYMYDRIFSVELSDGFMKLRLVNDIVIKIDYNPYRITITEPELEIDTDEIPDEFLPNRISDNIELN